MNRRSDSYCTNQERNIKKDRMQKEDANTSEYVIKRPLYWPAFLLILFWLSLLLCFLDIPSAEGKELFDFLAVGFYLFAGFSIWIPVTVLIFILLAVNFYSYFRFKLVLHEHGLTVTPLFGATHEVAFSSVEKVTHVNRFHKKGYYIDIAYDNKKIHIPYTVNRKGRIRHKGIEVLLQKFESDKTHYTEG